MNNTRLYLRAIFLGLCIPLLMISCTKETLLNKVPVVDAGQTQNVKIPEVTLTGSASDSDGHVVAYLWSQVSGPGASTILNAGSPSTKVMGLSNGRYVFQLMATDNNGATGVDTVSVFVNVPNVVTKTLTLQPINNTAEYKLNLRGSDSWAQGDNFEFVICAWTWDGATFNNRMALKFDMSQIPANAVVQSAKLALYSYPVAPLNGNHVDPNYGTSNSFTIRQINGNWNPSAFNWATPIPVTEANKVTVPTTNESRLDLNLDVKGMVASQINGNANYGFHMMLDNEVTYNSRIFVGSYSVPYAEKRPKLEITYQVAQ
ncbi:DNRLRE domain-containing protein [Pseudoflavitalea sp. G-6-1-2]|uniref:PKD domain-containing protein n=1 Tax=Pseudoflavitalea sp. G-6-1-2 TaxID=2728841 RepID=UPI00146B68B8|nr:DNRLRE domain-containing protein [Pseudoflavitalea sp. G-6-1-2]NML23426.1 DNRLRE domain-containing protein [Pseudoflavitalea sp. G-6-1-2]